MTVATERAAAQQLVSEVQATQTSPDIESTCPDSYEPLPEVSDVCTRMVPAMQADATRPAETRGQAGACYRVVSRETFCEQGELRGNGCVVEGPPPVERRTGVGAPLICPPGFGVNGERIVSSSVLSRQQIRRQGHWHAVTASARSTPCASSTRMQFAALRSVRSGLCQLTMVARSSFSMPGTPSSAQMPRRRCWIPVVCRDRFHRAAQRHRDMRRLLPRRLCPGQP